MAINLSSVSTTAMTNFNLSLGHTSLTALTTTYETGLTSVYTSPSYTPSGTGWQTITFSTPFVWDGTSNVILQICEGNNPAWSTGSGVYYSTTSFNSTHYGYMDSGTGCSMTAPTNNLVGMNRPNIKFGGMTTTVCSSVRTLVNATVTSPDPLTITANQTVCNNSIATISVTSTLANYDSYVWTPVTDLFTDAAATIPYVSGASVTTVYVKSATAGTVTYTCNANNSSTLCSNVTTSDVTILPSAVTISASITQICGSGTSILTALPSTGYGAATLQWQNSSDNVTFTDIASATSTAYTTPVLTSTTYYQILVKVGATTCSTSNIVTVVVDDPQVVTTVPASRCGTGTVTLGATGSVGSTLNWYDSATGGTSLGTGVSFTTPVISSTTSYYVDAAVGNTSYIVGAANTGISASLASQTTTTSGINFDVLSPSVNINSIDIYPTATIGSTFTITVKQGVTIIATYTGTTTVQGSTTTPLVQTVPVNFTIPAGTGYQITLPTNPGIIRNSGGDVFHTPFLVLFR